MTRSATSTDRYASEFRDFERSVGANDPKWIRRTREDALAIFSELGFPTARRGNERWKYTNVAPIAGATFDLLHPSPNGVGKADIQGLAPWHDSWATLVFVNGHYSDVLSTPPPSDNGVRVTTLAQAIASNVEQVEANLAQHASVEGDGFTALNTAFVRDGAFVHIPEGEALQSPLHLVFVTADQGKPTVSYPRVLLVAGRGSKCTIVESYIGLSQSRYFTNGVSEMVIGDDADVEHYRLLLESDNSFHVGVARVRQGENSTFTSSAFDKGAALGRYDLDVLLDGPGASCRLNGLYMTSGSQHMDNLISIDHAKPHTTSRLYYKGILDGKSRAVFGGTVLVRKDAQKTDALQSDKNLVLSPDAEVDSKPALFIYADDVKCGHGATAGNIDPDTVFYMRSRGLDLETASQLLIRGFASEITEAVRLEELRAYLEKRFLDALPSYKFEF